MKSKFDKYHNPDMACNYPFTPDSLGYCWGYATFIDEHPNASEQEITEWMKKYCRDCDEYLEEH